jgi:hypothetical protein
MVSSCIVEGCLFLLRNWSQLLCFASFLNLTMNRVQFHKRCVFPVLFKTVNAGQNAVTKFVSDISEELSHQLSVVLRACRLSVPETNFTHLFIQLFC